MNEPMMTIGFDAKRLSLPATGLGAYGRTLVDDLTAMQAFDLRFYAPESGVKALWGQRALLRRMERDGVQVFHGLSGELPRGISDTGIRSVVTIHDLIPLRHPEYYSRAEVKAYGKKLAQTLREADRIVAVSACTRRDVCELGEVDASRVEVVYQSCAPRFAEMPAAARMWQVRDRYDLPDRYVLSVGAIEERRNVLLAVQALHDLPDDVSLVIVGRQTPYSDRVHGYVLEHRMHSRVQMLHNVPDDDLPSLYRMADCFVYPSRYEGFGLPIVEAISMGLPVVACTGSCLEEAGGPDSLYVDPDDRQAMAHAIAQVLFGAPGRQQRIDRSRQYIARFENVDTARRFAELYKSLL